jgi:diguanylate cyclase (GGDEF)-like protein
MAADLASARDCARLLDCLRGARAVVVALLDETGGLRDANAGFRRLLGLADDGPLPDACAPYFLAPRLAELLAVLPDAEGRVYAGILNIGDPERADVSLLGSIYRKAGGLLLVGEYDVVELGELNTRILSLNEQLAEAQRDLLRANRRLQENEARQRALSLTDFLTGLANRRRIEERLQDEFLRSRRSARPFAVIMSDIDHFKLINDRYGHAVGDRVLQEVAARLGRNVRDCDLVARWGGEEFVVLLPETDLATAVEVAGRLHAALAGLQPAGVDWPVTASFGVAAYAADADADGYAVVRRADHGLYRAKEAGRNRVVADDPAGTLPPG